MQSAERGNLMEGTPYNISDAAKILCVEDHALRYWESQLGIEIPRNSCGYRYYEEEQIILLQEVKRLKEKGFTLKQIKAVLPKIQKVALLPEDKLMALRKQLEGLIGKEESSDVVQLVPKTPVCVEKESSKSRMEEFKAVMEEIMLHALQKNNEALSESIQTSVSERVIREMNYRFKEREEQEEERYRKLDRTIREYQQARQRVAATVEKGKK